MKNRRLKNMTMAGVAAIAGLLLLNGVIAANTQTDDGLSEKNINAIFELEKSYVNNAFETVRATGKLPRSAEKGFQPASDWTSGFYPGNLWLVYEHTRDESIKKKAEYATALLEEQQYNVEDHDIGFRIYCSYGNAYRLTGLPEYREVIIRAAKSAVKRYNPGVKAIMSWQASKERDWAFPVIIDNMMNLELLLAATQLTGDSSYYWVAVNHAATTMKNQYRADFSCSHVVDYDPATGKMRRRDWNNGNSDPATAAWSRGQSWGLYGFTCMYKYTRQQEFLDHAKHIAAFILNNRNLPADMVPFWDFNAPLVPTVRDASAAALLASALMQLSELSGKDGMRYFKAGEKVLASLSAPPYLNNSKAGNYLLNHATGNFLRKSEVDGTLIYADYYFLEALLRYKKLKQRAAREETTNTNS